jgi:hypothetical protein
MALSDDQIKSLIYGLMVDEYPGYTAYGEVLWENFDETHDYEDEEWDRTCDRVQHFIQTAQVNITWPDDVD